MLVASRRWNNQQRVPAHGSPGAAQMAIRIVGSAEMASPGLSTRVHTVSDSSNCGTFVGHTRGKQNVQMTRELFEGKVLDYWRFKACEMGTLDLRFCMTMPIVLPVHYSPRWWGIQGSLR
jgi:hypothetical protein